MDKYNSDEMESPSWMDRDFLEKVLKNSMQCKELKIKNFTISPATQKGDHFASVMFRVNIEFIKDGKTEETAIIIKTMPSEDGVKLEMLKQTYVFQTEIGMYNEVIPKFHKILRDCGDETILGARMLYYSLEPHKVIVFEDLTRQGYTSAENKLLTFDEVKLILAKICRWHAISFKLINEGDPLLNKYINGVFSISNEIFDGFIDNGLQHFMEILSNLPDQIYYEKFKKIKNNFRDELYKLYQKSNTFCVLNHGDFHIKNLMFKGKESLEDIMLVDFQFCMLATVAIDVLYILYMIGDKECRARREEIIYLYYTEFVEILKKIKYTGRIPTIAELHVELIKSKYLELYIVASMLPFACNLDGMSDVDMKDLVESKDARNVFYTRPNYIEELKSILPQLLHRGCFDE